MHRPKLLYFLHNFHNRGGTEKHVKTLFTELKSSYEIAFLFPENGEVILRFADTEEEYSFGGESVEGPFFVKEQPLVNKAVLTAISSFDPQLIHIHHLCNWPMSVLSTVLDYSQMKGIKSLITFHDYFFITPVFTMQGVNSVQAAMSEQYSKAIFGKDIRPLLKQRQEYFKTQFQRVNTFITPSEFAAKTIQEVFSLPIRVIPHGITPFKLEPKIPGRLRFGFVGSLLPQKGWRELLKAWSMANLPDAELHLYGGAQIPDILPERVFYHGVYEQEDLPRIFSQLDIGIIPSVFPETFSIVLSEMQQGGLPVIGTSFGAIPERIIPGQTGWIVNPYETEAFSDLLQTVSVDRSWTNWIIPLTKYSSVMAKEYSNLYSS